MSVGTFWDAIAAVLAAARKADTADELIAAVAAGPDQAARDGGADAFFAGSGGEDQLVYELNPASWMVGYVEGDYWWKATSKVDGSVVEYIEGDLYRRES